jgi:ribosomal protein L32
MPFFHYLFLFDSCNIKGFFVNRAQIFKWPAKRESYSKADCRHLHHDAKRLSTIKCKMKCKVLESPDHVNPVTSSYSDKHFPQKISPNISLPIAVRYADVEFLPRCQPRCAVLS